MISDIAWFKEHYSEAVALLGYSSVVERWSIREAFDKSHPDFREIFYPKEKITSYNQIINANGLAHVIRSTVQKYFGPLDIDDAEFVESCYVNQRAHDKSLAGIRNLINDSVSPFMQSYGVIETEDADTGGAFANRLVKGVKQAVAGDVVILFGGKGAGKSTFIKKVLLHKPPQFIVKHALPIIVDLLPASKDPQSIRERLWQTLITGLDSERLLDGDRDDLVKLFSDRFDVAKKQNLKGLSEDSSDYNVTLNGLIATWKADLRYTAKRLVVWHQRHHRGVILAIDNTDQLENELQDYAFSLAVETSNELGCLVLISMREERFYASKVRGMLDAYQNSAFHISSPTPEEVFKRRIQYVLNLLGKNALSIPPDWKEPAEKFFRIFAEDFLRNPPSSLNRFISASAHGNIRLALELFGDLVLSGYTKAIEMTQSNNVWTILIHQVLRPLLTPTRLFYDEKLSKVPNLFQIRATEGGSHFTGLRILRKLSAGQDPSAPAYLPFEEIRSYFSDVFGSDDDFSIWVDKLLAANLIEASTRQDSFSDEIDALRITSFGQFAVSDLHKLFTYIDLVSTDCGIRNESTTNNLVRLSNLEVQALNERRRLERVEQRINRTDAFIEYLLLEEQRELEFFSLGEGHAFVPGIIESWKMEKLGVLQSARKPKNSR